MDPQILIATATMEQRHVLAPFRNYVFLDVLRDEVFAPTENLLENQQRMPRAKFATAYQRLMRQSYLANAAHWHDIIALANHKTLVLGCHCPPTEFCHRDLLRKYIQEVALRQGYSVTQDYAFPDSLFEVGGAA